MSEYDDLLDDVLGDAVRPGPETAPSEITSNRKEAVGDKSGSAGKAPPGRRASAKKQRAKPATKSSLTAPKEQAKRDTDPIQAAPTEPARRGMSRQLERSGRCPMYAPRGTVCKTCGKVHPV